MKTRSRDYMSRRKAISAMQHPEDLKSFLIAEHDSSRNLIVKKDIRKMIDTLEAGAGENSSSIADHSATPSDG